MAAAMINHKHWNQGLANRTSEKSKPGPLELTLFFKARMMVTTSSESDTEMVNYDTEMILIQILMLIFSFAGKRQTHI